eukprot:2355054-Rhodomonas_salina.1
MMCGTEIRYGGTLSHRTERAVVCCAMCGTEIAYGAMAEGGYNSRITVRYVRLEKVIRYPSTAYRVVPYPIPAALPVAPHAIPVPHTT